MDKSLLQLQPNMCVAATSLVVNPAVIREGSGNACDVDLRALMPGNNLTQGRYFLRSPELCPASCGMC